MDTPRGEPPGDPLGDCCICGEPDAPPIPTVGKGAWYAHPGVCERALMAKEQALCRCEYCGEPDGLPILWVRGVDHLVHRRCATKLADALMRQAYDQAEQDNVL